MTTPGTETQGRAATRRPSTTLLRYVPDVKTGLIGIGNLEQFQFSFWNFDVLGSVRPELYDVEVSTVSLVYFLHGPDLLFVDQSDNVVMDKPRFRHTHPVGIWMLRPSTMDAA